MVDESPPTPQPTRLRVGRGQHVRGLDAQTNLTRLQDQALLVVIDRDRLAERVLQRRVNRRRVAGAEIQPGQAHPGRHRPLRVRVPIGLRRHKPRRGDQQEQNDDLPHSPLHRTEP